MDDWFWRLDGRTPRPCSMHEWIASLPPERDKRDPDHPWRVALTDLDDDAEVSTVFLGINIGWSDDRPPELFETMTFRSGTELDQVGFRTATWDAALAMHDQIVATVRDAARVEKRK